LRHAERLGGIVQIIASEGEERSAADAEQQLLLQAHLRSAAVELSRDAAIGGEVGRIAAVEQKESRAIQLVENSSRDVEHSEVGVASLE
jgi:hypothetical protein